MIDLIQRLHSAGIGNDATHFWNFCVKVADTLEKQEAECAKWKATAYENSGLVPTDNMATENQVLRTEIEELKIQWAKLSEAVYLLSEGNVTLIKERDSARVEIDRHIMEVDASRDRIEDLEEELTALKAQAAKDAADAGRRVAVITLYHGAGLAAANYIDQLGGVSKHYRVTLEAMKESQQ